MSFGYCQKTTTSKWEEENHKINVQTVATMFCLTGLSPNFDAIVGKYPI